VDERKLEKNSPEPPLRRGGGRTLTLWTTEVARRGSSTCRAEVRLSGPSDGYRCAMPSRRRASTGASPAVDTAVEPAPPEAAAGFRVDVRRSAKRKRTVSAYREGDTIVVMIPARLTRAEEREWVDTMVDRVTRAERRRRPSDDALLARARQLSDRYLDGRCAPVSVRWVDNQLSRWGSCTPADRTIRLSSRMRGMPAYVVDYVLVHELAHLLVPGHDRDFWRLVDRYELTERARGYLEGASAAASLDIVDTDDDPETAG
jgi:predicted metal-dependent hydrolase